MLEPADRRIIALAIPALGSLAVEPLYVLVDTAIVGRLGTAQLGGLALSATVLALVINACTFLIYGTTERVARRIGAGDPTGAADAGVQAMWLGAIVAVPLALLVAAGAEVLGQALGGSNDVLGYATTYLRISAVGLPAVIFVLCAQGMQRGLSDYRTPMIVLIASNALNAVLEVVFVFGLHLGVPGSAWSTVIAQVLRRRGVRRGDPPTRGGGPSQATELDRDASAAVGRAQPAAALRIDARRGHRHHVTRRAHRRTDPRRATRSPSASSPSSPWPSTPSPSPPRPSSPSSSVPGTARRRPTPGTGWSA